MTAFLSYGSEIKPGRGLTTKLTTDIPGRLMSKNNRFCSLVRFGTCEIRRFNRALVVYERRQSQVFGSNNLPRDLCQHV